MAFTEQLICRANNYRCITCSIASAEYDDIKYLLLTWPKESWYDMKIYFTVEDFEVILVVLGPKFRGKGVSKIIFFDGLYLRIIISNSKWYWRPIGLWVTYLFWYQDPIMTVLVIWDDLNIYQINLKFSIVS